jgi:AcrR family transcriptional regulator
MASRVGLDRAAVVRAAIDIVDRDGVDALTMARLAASLGIRVPSLYAHVPGQTGLRRELWMWTVNDLGERLRESVMGRSEHEALAAFATAFRDYARAWPGRYQLTLTPPNPLDEAALDVGRRANSAFDAVIRSFGLTGEEAVHLGRAVRAAIHGFIGLEARYSLGPENIDESFEHLLQLLARGLVPAAAVAAAG